LIEHRVYVNITTRIIHVFHVFVVGTHVTHGHCHAPTSLLFSHFRQLLCCSQHIITAAIAATAATAATAVAVVAIHILGYGTR
jgi:hypothetical protein